MARLQLWKEHCSQQNKVNKVESQFRELLLLQLCSYPEKLLVQESQLLRHKKRNPKKNFREFLDDFFCCFNELFAFYRYLYFFSFFKFFSLLCHFYYVIFMTSLTISLWIFFGFHVYLVHEWEIYFLLINIHIYIIEMYVLNYLRK